MSVDRRLEELNEEIDNVIESLDRMYEQGLPESETELLWRELEYLYAERDVLRARFAGGVVPIETAFRMMVRPVSDAFIALAEAFAELAQKLKPALERFVGSVDQMRRRPTSYRLAFSSPEIAPGQLSRIEARGQAPPNRRPTLRGFQRQKGKG